jgi:metal-responsive CopG/Arc/MetJ family transcriptional regulator
MIAVRLDEDLLAQVDQERRRAHVTRARVVHEALALWIERRRLEEAIRRDQEGYARRPIKKDEFGPVLGAQVWPK